MNDDQANETALPEHLEAALQATAATWQAMASAGKNELNDLAALFEKDLQLPENQLVSFADVSLSDEAKRLHGMFICHLVTYVAVGMACASQESLDRAKRTFNPFDLGSTESWTHIQWANYSLIAAAFYYPQANWVQYCNALLLFARLCYPTVLGDDFLSIAYDAVKPLIDQATIEKYRYERSASTGEYIKLSDAAALSRAVQARVDSSKLRSLGAWAIGQQGTLSSASTEFNLLISAANNWIRQNGAAYLKALAG